MMSLLLMIVAAGAVAQMHDMKTMNGVKGSFVRFSSATGEQFASLLDAVPQEKYNWRPAEGVRSVAESFLHVASGNYITLKTMGGKVPDGIDIMKLEKSTSDKATIAEEVKKSFEAINEYVASLSDADLTREVDFFGNKMSVGDMVMFSSNHQHETLGQAITYARMVKVIPPWTAEREQKMKEAPKK
jgi:uncharacterized damage-inducible protein DinB